MTIIPPGYAEVVCEFDIAGDAGPAICAFGVSVDLITDPTELAEQIGPVWDTTPGLLLEMSSTVALREVRVTVGQDGGPDAVGSAPFNLVGQDPANAATPQVAYLLRKNTGFGGRAYRGRMFVPGVVEGNVTDAGLLDTTFRTALQAAADNFLAALDAQGNPMVLLHTSALIAPTPVVSLVVDAKVATQRRRLR